MVCHKSHFLQLHFSILLDICIWYRLESCDPILLIHFCTLFSPRLDLYLVNNCLVDLLFFMVPSITNSKLHLFQRKLFTCERFWLLLDCHNSSQTLTSFHSANKLPWYVGCYFHFIAKKEISLKSTYLLI